MRLSMRLAGRSPFMHLREAFRRPLTNSTHRLNPSSPRPPPPPNSESSDRIRRILSRTPKFLRPTLSVLHNAPFTYISAFLILHEITAFVPLLGLVGAFHYFHWLPPFFAEGRWVVDGVEKFGNYFRKRGWIDSGSKREASQLVQDGRADTVEVKRGRVSRWWGRGESGTRLVIEFATAYAVIKLLLPLRLLLSVWGAPWFARATVVPFNSMAKRILRRSWQPRPAVPKSGGTTSSSQSINNVKKTPPSPRRNEE